MCLSNVNFPHEKSSKTNVAAVAAGRYMQGILLDPYKRGKRGARRGLNITALVLSSISSQRTLTHHSTCLPALPSLLPLSPPLPSLAEVRVTATRMCAMAGADERFVGDSIRAGAQLCA